MIAAQNRYVTTSCFEDHGPCRHELMHNYGCNIHETQRPLTRPLEYLGGTESVSQRRGRLSQSWLLRKPQGTGVSSASARTLAVILQQMHMRAVGNQGLTSTIKKQHAECCLRHGRCHAFKWQPSRCYFECAGSQVIKISLKPSRRLY